MRTTLTTSARAASILVVGVTSSSFAQGAQARAPCNSDPARTTVCAVDDSLGAALIRADTVALSRFYGEDLASINYRDVRSTKPMLLRAIAAGRLRFDTLQVLERTVQLRGDTAIVAERMHQVATGAEGRHPAEVDYRRSYVRRAGRWELVAARITLPSP